MRTRDDLYRLVDPLRPETLDEAAAALLRYVPGRLVEEPPYPRSVGRLAKAAGRPRPVLTTAWRASGGGRIRRVIVVDTGPLVALTQSE